MSKQAVADALGSLSEYGIVHAFSVPPLAAKALCERMCELAIVDVHFGLAAMCMCECNNVCCWFASSVCAFPWLPRTCISAHV